LYGIPDASTEPGLISTPRGAQLVEFPISTVPMMGMRMPIAGGGYFRLFPYWLTRAGLRKLNQGLKKPFVFYLHPWEVDPEQPVISVPWRARFRHYNNLDRTKDRLRKLLDEFAFAPMSTVLSQAGLLAAD
jgi:hypothetical protein